MAFDSRKDLFKSVKQRKFLNKDFEGFKSDLFEYARIHFPDKIQDFSDSSLGGLFLELASYVGDVQSFYLDHQFHELDPTTATEFKNIERHLKNSSVKVVGGSPSVVYEDFSIEVPADSTQNPPVPLTSSLPIIQAGSTVKANNGIVFELLDDLNFNDSTNGKYDADIRIGNRDSNNNPTTFIMTRNGMCISGKRATETFSVNGFESFKKITLANSNVTQVISVRDSQDNEYYEVQFLTQDTVFKPILNYGNDNNLVKQNLILIPAPYRFITDTSLSTRLTTLTFGGGNALTMNDDAIPDPSNYALPLYGKTTFSRFTLNPTSLLQSPTMGVITPNSTITIEYRYGGGLNHNVAENSIRGLDNILMSFPNGPASNISQFVRRSLSVNNSQPANGGEDPPTVDDLKALIPANRASQERIVTKEDLLARVYSMPSNFGRVYRASVKENANNPLATQLYIISRNAEKQLIISPDSLKKNLETYLNSYRMISDAIDIMDAKIINIKVEFSVVINPEHNTNIVLQNIISRLKNYFQTSNFQIDQPIVISDLHNIIYNNTGVISVNSVKIKNITNSIGEREYSDIQYDIDSNIIKGILVGPPGSIFEVKYPDFDIEGTSL